MWREWMLGQRYLDVEGMDPKGTYLQVPTSLLFINVCKLDVLVNIWGTEKRVMRWLKPYIVRSSNRNANHYLNLTHKPREAGNVKQFLLWMLKSGRATNLIHEGLVSNPCSLSCSGQLGGPVLAHKAPLSSFHSVTTPFGPTVASQHSGGQLHTAPSG